ncbi:MAG: hypothetical protein JEY96_01190 [Bacteroidales bacterium]|nr:hypothetical protein [Bacteroidales bacterium]
MIKVDFNIKNGYLDSIFIGDIRKEDLIEYIDATKINELYPRKLKILTDSKKANMLLSKSDLKDVVDANLKSLQQYDYIIDAIVTKNPKETAYSFMYKELSATKKYRFEVFSTRDAAVEWLEMQ